MDFCSPKESIPVLLLDQLKQLNDKEMKEFKWYLSKPMFEELNPIHKSQLADLHETEVVDLMIKHCCEEDALKVMHSILREMKLNNQALELKKALQKGNQARRELLNSRDEFQYEPSIEPPTDGWKEKCRHVQGKIKLRLKQKFQCIFEAIPKQGITTLLNDIYTELYITEAENGTVNDERQIGKMYWKKNTQESAIPCSDIFKPLPGQRKKIRTVLMKGIAGIGKTVSVMKFVLDWTDGKANQDIFFVFPLHFRDLNQLKEKQYSLTQLIHQYFPEMKEIENVALADFKILFIFDGLDECRLPLDFNNNETWCDDKESAAVDVLVTSLIRGDLLPSAFLWITSRPAAPNQIPPDCVQQLMEVQGFKDEQKKEYFTKRFKDQTLGHKIFAHIKSSRTLFTICHIPIFCWISATVLEHLLGKEGKEEIPKTLTQMYTHFLLIQIRIKNLKYQRNYEANAKTLSKEDKDIILKLGKLAFHALEKGDVTFNGEYLNAHGIDVNEEFVYSGMCTEIFKEEFGLYREKMYLFVHQSLQEYLAALYVFYLCTQENINILYPGVYKQEEHHYLVNKHKANSVRTALSALHISAVNMALQSNNGHLDLFLQFILGISLESNQTLLLGLLTSTKKENWSIEETVTYIKSKIMQESSPDRIINLFHCLNEINDNSLVHEIQTYLKTGKLKDTKLRANQCSALAFVLLKSEDVLDDFDLKTYSTSDLGRERLMPVVEYCRTATLDSCGLTKSSYEKVASALQVTNSHLRALNLSYNNLEDSGLLCLAAGLRSQHCRLERLLLSGCHFTMVGCEILVSALHLNPSHLRELDVSYNHVGDCGVRLLCAELSCASHKLEKLTLAECCLSEGCCGDLASLLAPAHSGLRELELRDNDLKDSGVKQLFDELKDSNCKLQRLGLSGCQITEKACGFLCQALPLKMSHLRDLDLSYNHLGDSGKTMLSALLDDPSSRLKKILIDHCGESRDRPRLQKYFCNMSLDSLTAHRCLSLTDGNRRVTCGTEEQPYLSHPERFDHEMQVLCLEKLSERCYWEVDFNGVVDIGVAYKGICRKTCNSRLGMNDRSWCLHCCGTFLIVCNNKQMTVIHPARAELQRVGVFLDYQAGILSFYDVSPGTVTHIHSFCTMFTEPLYAGIRLFPSASASLRDLQ